MIAISSYYGRNGFFEGKIIKKDVDIMVENRKCLEYYLDSRIYDKEEIRKNIEETKKEFPKKEIEVDIQLNNWGVYVVTYYFKNKEKKKNKKQEFSYIIKKNKKENKIATIYEQKTYGQYKSTKTYKPY